MKYSFARGLNKIENMRISQIPFFKETIKIVLKQSQFTQRERLKTLWLVVLLSLKETFFKFTFEENLNENFFP